MAKVNLRKRDDDSRFYEIEIKEEDGKFLLYRMWGTEGVNGESFEKIEGPFSSIEEAESKGKEVFRSLQAKSNFVPTGSVPDTFKKTTLKSNPVKPAIHKGNTIQSSPSPVSDQQTKKEDIDLVEEAKLLLTMAEEESEDESFVLEGEESEEESDEDSLESLEPTPASKITDYWDTINEEAEYETIDDPITVDMQESSMALNMFLKMFFQLPENRRKNVLDRLPCAVKVEFTLQLAAALTGSSTPPTAPVQKKLPSKPKKTAQQQPTKQKKSKSQSKKSTEKKEKKKTTVGHTEPENTCEYVFKRGKHKGETCGRKATEMVGGEHSCVQHKKHVEAAQEKKQEKGKKKEKTKPEATPKQQTKASNAEIVLSKRVHLCEQEVCDSCTQAECGDLRVCAYPHKETRTAGEKSGFLKSFVWTPEGTWKVVFISMNTAFDCWNERYAAFELLKEYFNEANLVRYQTLASGRFAYQLVCDPLGSHLPLIDTSISPSTPSSSVKASSVLDNVNSLSSQDKEACNDPPGIMRIIPEMPKLTEADNKVPEVTISTDTELTGNEEEKLEQAKDPRDLDHRIRERTQVHAIFQQKRVAGQEWNLLSLSWFSKWKEYVAYGISDRETKAAMLLSEHPGEVDNSTLVIPSDDVSPLELRNGLESGIDYVVIPPAAWEFFVNHYGGGPAIQRPLVELVIEDSAQIDIELYPILVKVVTENEEDKQTLGPWEFSERATIQSLIEHYFRENPKPDESNPTAQCKLFRYFQGEKKQQYEDHSATLQEAGIHDGATVYLEISKDELKSQ